MNARGAGPADGLAKITVGIVGAAMQVSNANPLVRLLSRSFPFLVNLDKALELNPEFFGAAALLVNLFSA